jgi:hypothetical protein
VVEENPRPGVCPREKGEDLLYRRRPLPGGHLAVFRRWTFTSNLWTSISLSLRPTR